jgi:hypothetical protein
MDVISGGPRTGILGQVPCFDGGCECVTDCGCEDLCIPFGFDDPGDCICKCILPGQPGADNSIRPT